MLLTVAIPSYNRDQNLRATLLNFIAQIEQYGLQEVEIVVSDNCSTDHTQQVCADVAVDHPDVCIRYFLNDTNVGFDRNVDSLFRHARGKYVWTFSDDDIPGAGALFTIVDLLLQRDVRFAFVNYEVSMNGQSIASRFGIGDNHWLDARDLLKTIRFSNSLISSCIYLREAWIQAGADKYVGTLWIHFFMAREILQNGLGLIVGGRMFVMMQSGLEKSRAEKREEDSAQVEYYMLAHLKFVEFASDLPQYDFDQETSALARALGRAEDIHQVINFKLTAIRYSVSQIAATWQLMAKYRRNDPQFWAVITPLLVAPGWTLKLARATYRGIKTWRR